MGRRFDLGCVIWLGWDGVARRWCLVLVWRTSGNLHG